ncbi:unnamed protein product [Polarella glacialis]|uniref:Choice-of-anchor I domain-containing protein n=1 Tax=Polarella glacialis TaxID=89957 RepID=A0A813GQW5_POLGL|nr:unnamed protein product [Polarella glacialis]
MPMTIARVVLNLLCISGIVALDEHRRLGSTPSVSVAEGTAAPTGIKLISRVYVPYDGKGKKAFGMGACEQIAYDHVEKYAYAASEMGYINVIDFSTPTSPTVTSFGIDFAGLVLTDVEVCGGMLFVGMSGASMTSAGSVKIYETVKRASPAAPKLKSTVVVGALPDMVLPNNKCTALAVANEGEGVYASGLTDPVGSVSIITDLSAAAPKVTTVDLGALCQNDEACIAKGVHLPLPLKAMEYFDEHSVKFKSKLDFTTARASYTTATQFEPEYVAWSLDDSTIYVNLQENSAVVTINATAGTATSIHAYGLKDWSSAGTTDGIDTVKDNDCKLEKKPGFKSMRTPDSIATFVVGGVTYIVTANEGDDKEYGDFKEKQKFKDIISSATAFKSDYAEFVPGAGMADAFANFGGTKMSITIGSTAVDYSTPTAPIFKAAVGFGGRGLTIYKASDMSLVWDSGSDFEREQCKAYPWAHNGIQDEEFAPMTGPQNDLYASLVESSDLAKTIAEMNDPDGGDGCTDASGVAGACPLNNTIDERSLKDGANPEAVVIGYACGRMLMVTATEKSGTAFVYDVSDPTTPKLLFVHHLSPASQSKSPGAAYADSTLGDIDPESQIFLQASHSPTGKAGLLFAGAWSGTISFYEFEGCVEPVAATTTTNNNNESNTNESNTTSNTTSNTNESNTTSNTNESNTTAATTTMKATPPTVSAAHAPATSWTMLNVAFILVSFRVQA